MDRLHKKFRQTAHNVFHLLREIIPAKSFFIASTTEERFIILEMINIEGGCTIPTNVNEPLTDSYCHFVARDKAPLFIPDTTNSVLVERLKVTTDFTIGSYLGVPIFIEDSSVFGTLCALDPTPNILQTQHIKTMEKFAEIISGSIELERTLKQLKENEVKTKRELHLASELQTTLFNSKLLNKKIKIETMYYPTSHLSGDIFTWQKIDEGKYGIAILDVMGHGISSALIGMLVFSHLRDHILYASTPFDLLKTINQKLHQTFTESNNQGMFVTGIYVQIDMNKMELTYMNMGHPPAILVNDNEMILLNKSTLPLGIIKDVDNSSETIPITQDFQLILYTDGLLDCFERSSLSILERLQEKIKESILDDQKIVPILEALIQRGKENSDDICVVSIEGLKE